MRAKTSIIIVKNSIQSLPLNAEVRFGTTVKPKHLWLETTDRCNSRCQTCNIWKKPPTPKHELLTLAELERCLHDPVMNQIKEVLNSGGEATLTNLEEYLRIEHEAFPNASLQISSNALLPERLSQAVEYAMKIGIQHLDVGLSIDGVGEAHDAIRGVKGNFAKLEQSIALMKQLEKKYPGRIFTCIGSTLTDVTAKNASALYAYSKKVCMPFMWHWYNSSPFYENQEKTSLTTKKGIHTVIMNYPAQNLYMDMWRQSLTTGEIPKFRCLALKNFLAIKCNGDVVPCLSRWNENETVGNIRHQSISEIWYSKRMIAERQKIKSCEGCLNSWGYGWSIDDMYLQFLADLVKRKVKKFCM